MAPLVSRVVVALVGLPLVLVIVWAGGWWLFALAGVAAILALHEYALMIRSLRPVILAAYAGALLSLLGAHLAGLEWTVAGFLSTIVFAFLLHWIATTRQSATVAIASTVLGAAWIGLCLAHLLLLRQIPTDGELATFTDPPGGLGRRHRRILCGPAGRSSQACACTFPGEDLGGLPLRNLGHGLRCLRRAVQAGLPLDSGSRSCSAS